MASAANGAAAISAPGSQVGTPRTAHPSVSDGVAASPPQPPAPQPQAMPQYQAATPRSPAPRSPGRDVGVPMPAPSTLSAACTAAAVATAAAAAVAAAAQSAAAHSAAQSAHNTPHNMVNDHMYPAYSPRLGPISRDSPLTATMPATVQTTGSPSSATRGHSGAPAVNAVERAATTGSAAGSVGGGSVRSMSSQRRPTTPREIERGQRGSMDVSRPTESSRRRAAASAGGGSIVGVAPGISGFGAEPRASSVTAAAPVPGTPTGEMPVSPRQTTRYCIRQQVPIATPQRTGPSTPLSARRERPAVQQGAPPGHPTAMGAAQAAVSVSPRGGYAGARGGSVPMAANMAGAPMGTPRTGATSYPTAWSAVRPRLGPTR